MPRSAGVGHAFDGGDHFGRGQGRGRALPESCRGRALHDPRRARVPGLWGLHLLPLPRRGAICHPGDVRLVPTGRPIPCAVLAAMTAAFRDLLPVSAGARCWTRATRARPSPDRTRAEKKLDILRTALVPPTGRTGQPEALAALRRGSARDPDRGLPDGAANHCFPAPAQRRVNPDRDMVRPPPSRTPECRR